MKNTSSKGMIIIEVKEGEHNYQFIMPIGSPLGSAYNAAHSCLLEIVEMAKTAAENAKQQVNKEEVEN